jgi:hypothetical protein
MNSETVNNPSLLPLNVSNQTLIPISDDTIQHICTIVAESGRSVADVCKEMGIHHSVVYKRANSDPNIAQALACMRQSRAHVLADTLTDTLDKVESQVSNSEDHRKSDISIRFNDMKLRHVQWLIERTNPDYSNKQEIRIGPADSAAAIEQAWQRRMARDTEATEQVQVIREQIDHTNNCAIQSNNPTPTP